MPSVLRRDPAFAIARYKLIDLETSILGVMNIGEGVYSPRGHPCDELAVVL
jgi:hypothetical protein